ncbi:MAG TPA: outer membrane beta-barrel protein [Steroidobacteraceae bacterium]|nr:outer membrane beta-barrel protein [Steroidobacteraceae bacterium]
MTPWKAAFIVLSLLGLPAAHAAEPAFFEATLFGGYRFGGEFKIPADPGDPDAKREQYKFKSGASFGVTLNLQQEEGAYYELHYSRQDAEIKNTSAFDGAIEYLQIGGQLELGDFGPRVLPYMALTLGATRFTPKDNTFDTEVEPSIGLGFGVKFPFSKNFGARVEARGYATFVDSDSELFCVSADGKLTCAADIQGDAFVQGQALVGITFAF